MEHLEYNRTHDQHPDIEGNLLEYLVAHRPNCESNYESGNQYNHVMDVVLDRKQNNQHSHHEDHVMDVVLDRKQNNQHSHYVDYHCHHNGYGLYAG